MDRAQLSALVGFLAMLSAAAPAPASADALDELERLQAANDAYRVGTNAGMRYLTEHRERLWVVLLLQECELVGLASAAGGDLPNSVDYFFADREAASVPPSDRAFAAQATRAYLLGFETATRFDLRQRIEELGETAVCAHAARLADRFVE